MLIIRYSQVSTLLIQEVALAPTNWIGNINIPPGALLHQGSTQGSEERRSLMQHMRWAPSICVTVPNSSTNIPLHCFGNQCSRRPPNGQSFRNCFPDSTRYVVSVCVFWPVFVYKYQQAFVSVLPEQTHVNPALSWPCEHSSIHYSTLIVISWQRSPVGNVRTLLSFSLLPFPITLLAFSSEAPHPYCHLLAWHSYWLINKHG